MNSIPANDTQLFVIAELTDSIVTDVWTFSDLEKAESFMKLVWSERTEDFTQTGEDLVMYRTLLGRVVQRGHEFDWAEFDVLSRKNLSIDRYDAYRKWKVSRESADTRSYQYITDLDGVPVFDTLFGCAVILQSDLLDYLFGEDRLSPERDVSYLDSLEACEHWAKSHGAALYAAERHDFSLETAAWNARKDGKKVVIAEDLS